MPPARAKAIMDFETRIAKVSWNREDSSDATKTYNKMSLSQLAEARSGLRLGDLSHGARRQHRRAAGRPAERDQGIAALAARTPAARASRSVHRALARQLFRRSAQSGQGRKLRLLRHEAQRHPGDPAAVEAGGRLHHQHPHRRRVENLCREMVSAGIQGGDGASGRQHHRRHGPAHRQSELDGAGDQGQGQGQARRLHPPHRLSGAVARL